MIKFEYLEMDGLKAAIRGMRNPMDSWDYSDSFETHIENPESMNEAVFDYFVGDKDLALMHRLCKAGTDHRKFMRMMVLYVDITAPLYWWKEFDTYKVGTVANSCSTMHKLTSKKISEEDFSIDDGLLFHFVDTIVECERLRSEYVKTGDKKYWRALIQLLPESYNQRRTVMLNYEVLANMYKSRRNHKLDEWVDFCKWMEMLPYAELITGEC